MASGVFVVGGILGRGPMIFELERKWEALRKRPDIDISLFKASDCEHGKREFAKFVADPKNITLEERARLVSISQKFLSLLAAESIIIQGVGIVQDDFYAVIQDQKARSVLGDSP